LQELARLGCDLEGPFSTSLEVRRRFKPLLVDLALIDVRLDDGGTFELEQRLRSLRTPIMYLVGDEHSHWPVRVRDGSVKFIAKSCSVGDLLGLAEGLG
jgi:DNA-binding response OmpR family regulator